MFIYYWPREFKSCTDEWVSLSLVINAGFMGYCTRSGWQTTPGGTPLVSLHFGKSPLPRGTKEFMYCSFQWRGHWKGAVWREIWEMKSLRDDEIFAIPVRIFKVKHGANINEHRNILISPSKLANYPETLWHLTIRRVACSGTRRGPSSPSPLP